MCHQSNNVGTTGMGMIGNFGKVKSGGIVLLGATTIQLAKFLTSEVFSRALYFWVQAGPIVVHYKFTRWFLKKTKAPLEKRNEVYDSLHNKYSKRSFDIALHLRGLYVKMAQIISSRPDFVPPQYVDIFITAEDSLPQWSIDEVVNEINGTLHSEFGLSFDDVFEGIESIALGSASIGQVHKAKLKPEYASAGGYKGGDIVAVKVMHRGAEGRFHHDFQVFRWLCKVALKGWGPILDECYSQIMSEFDYRNEARSLSRVRRNMMISPFQGRIVVPEPVSKLSSKELLIMQMLEGKKWSEAIEDDLALALGGKEEASALIKAKRLDLILGKEKRQALREGATDASVGGKSSSFDWMKGLDLKKKLRLYSLYKRTKSYVDLMVDVQGHQILTNGVFQGDPHNGNILLMPNGSLGLIDYGQTKTLSHEQRLGVARIVLALGRKSGRAEIAKEMRALGFETKFGNEKTLAKYASLFFDSDVAAKDEGCSTPQLYFAKLTAEDPLVHVPDVAIFVARASFILRGMGTILDKQICTASRWMSQAEDALREQGHEDAAPL
ncbi:unnamed protein product [Cylindrotheca closterium]|uniref:ABC1 atypical kinase-like domain-containing protein n=1 Tax=Cylindrotheca closterium TaxID=2856 RepID=A0AAD2CA64_9STRA|nr:unnamed protein product [Cylindrotheca closterium]